MERLRKKTLEIIEANKREAFVVAAIIAVAAFLRLYQIREFVVFLGDEGRDALVVKRMVIDHKLTLLGPTASVGGFYLGPIYYYFMIPFLLAFRFDPVGPAVMVALLGIATVGLLYWAVRNWFAKTEAIVATALYATAPGIVSASRSSWNPNIMPFFALLSVFSLSKAIEENRAIWYIVAGAAYGVAIQSHYLGLILGPIIALATLLASPKKRWLKAALFELVGFVIGASMFIAFEARHGFPNTRSIIEFVSRGGNTTGPRNLNIAWLLYEMLRRTFEATMISEPSLIRGLVLASIVSLAIFVYRKRNSKEKISTASKVLFVWLIVGALGIGSYKGQLYAHYFGFLFPLPFILLGILGAMLIRWRKTRIIGIALTIALVSTNLANQSIWGQGSNLINQTKAVSEKVTQISRGKPYNFALLAEGNSDHAYRYFLEIMENRPLLLEEEVTEQLIVVCENLDTPCSPLGHPLWEVAGFGRAEIAEETTVPPGIGIIRLIHHKDSQDLIGKPAPKGG